MAFEQRFDISSSAIQQFDDDTRRKATSLYLGLAR